MRLMIALLLVASACVGADLPPNLRKDIDAANKAWIDGLKTGDAEHMVFGFSQDSVNCNASGECVSGPIAEAAKYREMIRELGRASSALVRSESLRVDDDLAYESGRAEADFPNGRVLRGRFCTVWQLQKDGHWKILRNMSLPPPQPR